MLVIPTQGQGTREYFHELLLVVDAAAVLLSLQVLYKLISKLDVAIVEVHGDNRLQVHRTLDKIPPNQQAILSHKIVALSFAIHTYKALY